MPPPPKKKQGGNTLVFYLNMNSSMTYHTYHLTEDGARKQAVTIACEWIAVVSGRSCCYGNGRCEVLTGPMTSEERGGGPAEYMEPMTSTSESSELTEITSFIMSASHTHTARSSLRPLVAATSARAGRWWPPCCVENTAAPGRHEASGSSGMSLVSLLDPTNSRLLR